MAVMTNVEVIAHYALNEGATMDQITGTCDPAHGSWCVSHNATEYNASVTCSCGFWSHGPQAKQRFREHIAMVQGVAYIPAEHLDVDWGSEDALDGADALDGDESYPQEAEEPFWKLATGWVWPPAPVTGDMWLSMGSIPSAAINNGKGWVEVSKIKVSPYTGLLGKTPTYQYQQQKVVFSPKVLDTFPMGNSSIPPASWLLDYAVKHYGVPSDATVVSVMKEDVTMGVVATFAWYQ